MSFSFLQFSGRKAKGTCWKSRSLSWPWLQTCQNFATFSGNVQIDADSYTLSTLTSLSFWWTRHGQGNWFRPVHRLGGVQKVGPPGQRGSVTRWYSVAAENCHVLKGTGEPQAKAPNIGGSPMLHSQRYVICTWSTCLVMDCRRTF